MFLAGAKILTYLLIGFLGARVGLLGSSALRILSWLVIYGVMPVLTWQNILTLHFTPSLLFAGLAPWIQLGVGTLICVGLARHRNYSQKLTRSMILVAGFSNTSFLGFPMLIALQGPHLLPIATVADQFGSFLALTWVGPWILSIAEGPWQSRVRAALRETLAFPPFWALLLATGVRQLLGPDRFTLPPLVFDWIRTALTPLTVLTVGVALHVYKNTDHSEASLFQALRDTLVLRLFILPLLVLGISYLIGLQKTEIGTTAVLEVAMAPMITSVLLGIEARLEVPFLLRALVLGIVLSFITLPLWSLFLTTLGHP
jgi:predicted permease